MSNASAPVQDEFFESLLGDFLDESQQLLGSLNENMLTLDQWVQSVAGGDDSQLDEELMNELFRSAHSFKGLSGMLGLTDINNLTHNIENVFDAARRGQYQLTPESVELLFHAIDHLVGMVECLRDPELPTDDCTEVIERIKSLLSDAGVGKEQQSQSDAEKSLAELDQALAAATTEESTPVETAPKEDLFADIEDESEVPAKYLAIYIDESEQSLDAISESLLSTEANNSVSTVEDVLIAAHRFKGSSASVGLNRAAKLAHFMEDILQLHREQQLSLSPDLTDAMLKCTDALRSFIEQLKQGQQPSVEGFNQLAYELIHANLKPGDADSADAENDTDEEKLIRGLPENIPTLDMARQTDLIAHISEDTVGVLGLISFDPTYPMLDLKAQLVLKKLSQLGHVRYSDPSEETLENCEDLTQLAFVLDSDHSPESVWRALHIASVKRVEVKRVKKLLSGEADHGEDGPDVKQYDYNLQAPAFKKPVEPTPEAKVTEQPEAPSADNSPLKMNEVAEQAASKPVPEATQPATPESKSAVTPPPKPIAAAKPAEQKSRAAKPAEASKPNETLRVDIERLDQLMNLAGQLVINKARFARIGEGLKPLLASKRSKSVMGSVSNTLSRISEEAETGLDAKNPQMQFELIRAHTRRLQADMDKIQNDLLMLAESRSGIADLIEAVHQLDRVSDGIQKSVMDTRMVPVGPLFTRFKRVVRDITRSNGKDIQLVIRGEKTELDKRMIDGLGDPLIHMVRNSADHGVETPEERIAAGKSPQGEIILDAFHRGNSIVIQIKDDGRGLPTEKLRQKAIDKGVISEADAEKLSPYQVYQLIWEPGFSTAEKVTEISGRGMGMDIVRSKIEELSGVVDLDSVPGEGTTFTIKLPLTLAILPSLMAKIQDEVFALPIESVVEIVSVRRDELSRVHGLQTATVRNRVVAITNLDEVFTWSSANESGCSVSKAKSEEITLVIIGVAGRELGLCVDQLLGEEDVVIKSMAENYRNVEGVAGASILGDGRVALILDTSALIDMAATKRRNIAEVTA